jgi:hypothetical protein
MGFMKSLVGERKALAATMLALWGFLYLLMGMSGAAGPMTNAILAIGAVYGLAFFGLVAGYFWARWFAVGVALFGVMQGVLAVWQLGFDYLPLFVLITHVIAAGFLWGESMSAGFDGKPEWRQKLSMDEHAANRLGNSVIRLGVSLPLVLAWALAPRSGSLAIAGAGLLVLATAGVVRMRTWGVFAMIGASGLLIGSIAQTPCAALTMSSTGLAPASPTLAAVAVGLVLAAVVPFAAPIRDFLRTRSR